MGKLPAFQLGEKTYSHYCPKGRTAGELESCLADSSSCAFFGGCGPEYGHLHVECGLTTDDIVTIPKDMLSYADGTPVVKKTPKAIPTEYKGITFRSRTEAKWAYFFDLLGWKWSYEEQGYDLEGIWYLPDFVIHDEYGDTTIEIKPYRDLLDEENQKLSRFFHQVSSDLILIRGTPDCYRAGWPRCTNEGGSLSWEEGKFSVYWMSGDGDRWPEIFIAERCFLGCSGDNLEYAGPPESIDALLGKAATFRGTS